MRRLLMAALVAASFLVSHQAPADAATTQIDQFDVTPDLVHAVAVAPDGSVWFVGAEPAGIGRVTPSGEVIHLDLPLTADLIASVLVAPDGRIWFVERKLGQPEIVHIARVNPDGTGFVEFPLNRPLLGLPAIPQYIPSDLMIGPNGNVWFGIEIALGEVTDAGEITLHFGPPARSGCTNSMTSPVIGPDGALWATAGTSSLVRFDAATEEFAEFPILPCPPQTMFTTGLAVGPDGNFWTTDFFDGHLARVTPNGTAVTFSIDGHPTDVVTAGGQLFVSRLDLNDIVRIDTATGSIVERYIAPTVDGHPVDLAADPSGNVWFAEQNGEVGRLRRSAYPSWFHPITPTRVLDSRANSTVGPFNTPWAPGHTRTVPIAGPGTIPRDASAIVANVTVTSTTATSHLTVWPAGGPKPNASVLNWSAGQTVANGQTIPIGAGGAIDVFNANGQSDVVIDVAGYYDGRRGHAFIALPPTRIQDSRATSAIGPYVTPWGQATSRDITVRGIGGVPGGASAVVLNITVTGTSATSHLTVWPTGQPKPVASSLNWSTGRTLANNVTVPVGSLGRLSIFNASGSAHVIVDVVGAFTSTGAAYHPATPVRIQDSRPTSPIGPYATPWSSGIVRPVTVADLDSVPADAIAVVVNVTVTSTSANGHLTMWSAGHEPPPTSTLNWVAGGTIANSATLAVGTGKQVLVSASSGSVDVVIDVTGYYR